MAIRELSGWAVALLLLVYPAVLFVSFLLFVAQDAPAASFLGTLLLGFAWPGLYLASRRLREPAELDVVEADGRAPVLLLHGYERSRTAWWRRIFWPASFLRDLADALHERALRKALDAAGPVLTLARPSPAPTHGPVSLVKDEGGWEPELRARLVGARLVAIVLDATADNERELDIVSTTVDPRRILLAAPATMDAAFQERFLALRTKLPGLPALDSRSVAVRFDKNRVPTVVSALYSSPGARRAVLGSASRILRRSELHAQISSPSISWVITAVPLAFAFLASVATPVLLGNELSLHGGKGLAWAMAIGVAAVLLAVMSRRAMRLVPSSELPMVLVAASPWLFGELFRWVESARPWQTEHGLEVAASGAAYSAPLLLATSFVLAGASLIRKSPDRKPSYGVFGLATVVPLATLATTITTGKLQTLLLFACFVCGVAMAVATVAATGEAGRRHAPLSVGSAAAATLALAAFSSASMHIEWRALLGQAEYGDYSITTGFHDQVAWREAFDDASIGFILAVPLVVVLVGMLFRGRATRGGAASALTLLPLVILLPMANAAHVRPRAIIEERNASVGDGLFASAAGAYLPDVTFASVTYTDNAPSGPVDIVLDRAGAIAGGERVAREVELASFGATGGPRLSRAISDLLVARGGTPVVRVAADPGANALALLATCRAAWAQGAPQVELVMRGPSGRPGAVAVRQAYLPVPGRELIMLYLEIDGSAVNLTGTDGTLIHMNRRPDGRLDLERLTESLRNRRERDPNRSDLNVAVAAGATAGDVLQAISIASAEGYFDLGLTDESRL